MGGTSTQSQQSNQQSQLTPWAPAGNQLQGLLGQLPTDISGGPQVANSLAQLYNIGQQPNPLAAPAMGAAGSQLGGAQNYGQATGILGKAYDATQQSLSPYTTGNAFDPTSNPALAQQLATVNADVSGQVNPLFAAAGRLASPDNAQALARGITQGSTGILQNAAQNQLGAINALQGAAGSTAGGLLGADVANAGIQSQGISNAPGAYSAQTQGPLASLQAALMGNQLPFQNAQSLTGILGPLAGMFGQQTGSGTQTGTQTMSPIQQALAASQMFGNIFGGQGGGAIGNAKTFFSDRRVKDDIVQIGVLYDGLPVYSFRYKGDPVGRVGLMAQDVEQVRPDAVVEIGGIKAVDYDKATENARSLSAKRDMSGGT